jgi:hypothetical protein
MLNFLADNMYVSFGDQVFQQSVVIPMGTNCALLLADLLLYTYEAEFVQKQQRTSSVLQPYIQIYRWYPINHNFHNYIHLVYSDELEIKDTTESDKSATYLDILLKGIVSKLMVKFCMCQNERLQQQKLTTNTVEWLQTH